MAKKFELDSGLRKIILAELLFPSVLLILGIYHGLLQVLYRAGVIRASSFLGLEYYQGLTLHGVVNAIVFTTFFAVAFGNAVIPYFLRKSISTRVAAISMWLMIIGTVSAAIPILAGKASVLYTFYPPLKAHPAFYIGLTLAVIGSWVAFFNWIPAYLSFRRENPKVKTPIAVLGMFTTFIVWFIATLPVAYEILVLLLPWSLGWVPTVNVVLARTLFWFFGHPLVYFWLLPAYVMYYAFLPKIAGGKLYSDFAARFAFMMFIVFSCPVGFHHQFADPGIAAGWKGLHSLFTFVIALPSFVTAFTLAATLEHAARERGGKGLFAWWGKLPYFDRERWLFPYLFCGLFLFIFGGITGIVNASYSMNMLVHNTSWLPAHFHMTVAGPVFLAFIGMSLYLVSELLGKEIKCKPLVLWVPYLWTLGICIFSSGLFWGGLHGEPRRTNLGLTYLNPTSPLFRKDWVLGADVGAIGGVVMTVAMVFFFIVLFATVFSKKTGKPGLEFPVSEALHEEDVPAVQNFKPWLVAAVLMLFVAYAIPIYDIATAHVPGASPFVPDSPVSVQSQ